MDNLEIEIVPNPGEKSPFPFEEEMDTITGQT